MKSQENDSDEKTRVIMNTMQANRNEYYVFIRQNAYKCGLNIVSNRLQSVSTWLNKTAIDQFHDSSKTVLGFDLKAASKSVLKIGKQ